MDGFTYNANFSSYNNRIICTIKDDIIYEMSTTGQMQEVGHTNKRFNELLDLANEYKDICIKNGLIEEEKTPEQVQMELMQSMMFAIQDLTKQVEVLKNGHKETSEPSDAGSKPNGGKQRKDPTSNKSSNADSTKHTN